jgi:hypothetical protein
MEIRDPSIVTLVSTAKHDILYRCRPAVGFRVLFFSYLTCTYTWRCALILACLLLSFRSKQASISLDIFTTLIHNFYEHNTLRQSSNSAQRHKTLNSIVHTIYIFRPSQLAICSVSTNCAKIWTTTRLYDCMLSASNQRDCVGCRSSTGHSLQLGGS